MVSIDKSGLDCISATKPASDPTVLGIDPGQTGAVALIHARKLSVYDYKGPEHSVKLIRALKEKYAPDFAIIEKQWLWGRNERSIKRAEVLIRSAQMWETLMYVNEIPFITLSAKNWREGVVNETPKEKKGYIDIANQIFDDSIHIFTRHDRAEAALIAYKAYFRAKK